MNRAEKNLGVLRLITGVKAADEIRDDQIPGFDQRGPHPITDFCWGLGGKVHFRGPTTAPCQLAIAIRAHIATMRRYGESRAFGMN